MWVRGSMSARRLRDEFNFYRQVLIDLRPFSTPEYLDKTTCGNPRDIMRSYNSIHLLWKYIAKGEDLIAAKWDTVCYRSFASIALPTEDFASDNVFEDSDDD
ncbi:unnamed protein product [Arabidopsis halleri]